MTRTNLTPTAPTWAVVSRNGTVETLTALDAGQTLSTMSTVDPFLTRAEAVAAAQAIDSDYQPDEPAPARARRPPTSAERIAALEERLDAVAALEERLDAVAALAEAANTTAQEVARAARPSGRTLV